MLRLSPVLRKSLEKVTQYPTHFEINQDFQVSFAWLRDQCKSPDIYDARTNQKKVEFPQTTEITHFEYNKSQLFLTWKDGLQSKYDFQDLQKVKTHQNTSSSWIQPKIWDSNHFPGFQESSVDFKEYMNTNEGLKAALEMICLHGFAFISGSPVSTEKGTKIVAERIGPIYRSTYGDHWELASKMQEHASDASYGNAAIEPHTDATYLYPAIGIQLFHCLQSSSCGGGDTILVDGFQLASDFQKMYPDGYKFLSTYPIEAQYKHTVSEPKAHYKSKEPIFKLYPDSEELMQVRINAYRIFPENIHLEDQLKFYEYFPKLIQMTKEDKYAKKFALQPGNILLVNNWRLLHGRTGFTGSRILSGCYLGHIDFMSRCRSLGISIREPL